MIPLNKPLIIRNRVDKTFHADVFLSGLYETPNVNLVFSARQGLDFIYKHIYETKGPCNVAVSPLTCFEALYPIIHNKHKLVFVDVNPDTFNMDENKVPDNVQVIQAIHFGGNPQQMDILHKRAKESNTILVEDCAQAFGSKFDDIPVGIFGEYAAFSLLKNIHAIGGGFIVSKNKFNMPLLNSVGKQVSYYRSVKREIESYVSYNTPILNSFLGWLISLKPETTEQVFSNNNINSIMLKSIDKQLLNAKILLSKRNDVANQLLSKINNDNFVPQLIPEKGNSSYTRLLFKVKDKGSKLYIQKLRNQKIGANHLSQNYKSSYQKDVFSSFDFRDFAKKESLPRYCKLHDHIISIPVSPSLNQREINYISGCVNRL